MASRKSAKVSGATSKRKMWRRGLGEGIDSTFSFGIDDDVSHEHGGSPTVKIMHESITFKVLARPAPVSLQDPSASEGPASGTANEE